MTEKTKSKLDGKCPHCGSWELIRCGRVFSGAKKMQRWVCKNCSRTTSYPVKE